MSAFPGEDIIDLSDDDDDDEKPPTIVIRDDEAMPHPPPPLPQNPSLHPHVQATVDDEAEEEEGPRPSGLPLAAVLPEMLRPREEDPTLAGLKHLFSKVMTRVHVQSREKAKAFGERFSAIRPQDDTLAVFCDGSASGHIPEALAKVRFEHLQGTANGKSYRNKRYISAGIAYKTDPSQIGWQSSGFPCPHLWASSDGELFGFKEGLAKFKHLHLHGGHNHLKRLLLFSDAQGIINVLQTIQERRNLPNWDLHLLQEFMELLVELVDIYGLEVEIHWVPGHKGVVGNIMADKAAALARPDKLWPEMYPTSIRSHNDAHRMGRRANNLNPTPAGSERGSERQDGLNRGIKRARSSVGDSNVAAGCHPDVPIEVSDGEEETGHRPKKHKVGI
ncbi:uncharacterized protein LTHEOB_8313 [Neofusicoccum parvum]|uniref:Uncharacterized protein LTHEOB_8313 n=1 Tax=Neofusicoccum parvum TaxID=310453 RepID=A0ACB5S1I6_9PEZI|nr:uncharacterized protein LTHEOB_8313 [Neofusicoccum parvum]